jgi:stage III sporulation protein SpoIIIAA
VTLIGTAHGRLLENLLKNPTLSDLVGGIQSVTLGDDEARARGTQKVRPRVSQISRLHVLTIGEPVITQATWPETLTLFVVSVKRQRQSWNAKPRPRFPF